MQFFLFYNFSKFHRKEQNQPIFSSKKAWRLKHCSLSSLCLILDYYFVLTERLSSRGKSKHKVLEFFKLFGFRVREGKEPFFNQKLVYKWNVIKWDLDQRK